MAAAVQRNKLLTNQGVSAYKAGYVRFKSTCHGEDLKLGSRRSSFSHTGESNVSGGQECEKLK